MIAFELEQMGVGSLRRKPKWNGHESIGPETEKQTVAMKEAGINYVYQSVYELTYSCLIRLLGE